MKKTVFSVLALIFTMTFLSACSEEEAPEITEKKIAVTSPEPKASVSEASASVSMPDETSDEITLSSIEGVDIDLTSLSSTVVYAQVYNMMYYPENFIGKTIRMEGLYSDYFDQAKGIHYFACIIMDATACCSQGVEFELADEYSYPEDYPAEGDNIIVEGIFDVYDEDGYSYCTLRASRLIEG